MSVPSFNDFLNELDVEKLNYDISDDDIADVLRYAQFIIEKKKSEK